MKGVDIAPYQDFSRKKLGFEFNDVSLLVTAMTHRSYVNEHKATVKEHNERLEFLGDAVLELAVTRFLFENYDKPEGVLTAWRSALVRTESIAVAGSNLGYAPLMRMSRGEKHGSEAAKLHIVANAFEALIGAIYLDQGYDVAEKFVQKNILSRLDSILEDESWRDPKSHLQEVSQRIDGQTPQYHVLGEEGPDHAKIFEVGVFVNKKMLAKGKGSSKSTAQQEAAKTALKTYGKEKSERSR